MKKSVTLIVLFLSCTIWGYTQSVAIGTQTWSTKNLNVYTFSNGDSIFKANTKIEWEKAVSEGKPAWCYYDFKISNAAKFGKLYNWYAVNDSRGLAPKGWHLPRINEIEQLIKTLGGEDVAGGKMKTTTGWVSYGFESNGDNKSKFSALPGGYFSYNNDWYFSGIKYQTMWWSASESNFENAYSIFLASGGEGWRGNSIGIEIESKKNGKYVRCLKD